MLVVLLKCSESMVRAGVSPCADHNENVGQLYVRNRAGEPRRTVITFCIGGNSPVPSHMTLLPVQSLPGM